MLQLRPDVLEQKVPQLQDSEGGDGGDERGALDQERISLSPFLASSAKIKMQQSRTSFPLMLIGGRRTHSSHLGNRK